MGAVPLSDGPPARAADADPAARPPWRVVVGLLAALVFAGIALGQLQTLLSGMHVSGRPSFSIGGLNHLFHLGADPAKTAGTISVWHEYAAATSGQGIPTADPHRVVWWAVLVDSLLFAPLYVATIGAFLRRGRAEVTAWAAPAAGAAEPASRRDTFLDGSLERTGFGAGEARDLYARIALAGMLAVVVAGVADEVENVSNLLLVDRSWDAGPGFGGAGWFHAVAWVLWLSGWVKVALIAAALGAVLIVGWALVAARPGRAGGTRIHHRLVPVRLHLGVVAVVVLALFAHEQMPDLVRRWSPVGLVLDLALAALLALAVWATSRLLLTRGPIRRRPRWTLRRLLVGIGAIGAAAVLQVALHFAHTGSYRAGWGLAVPAAMVLGLCALSLVLPSGETRSGEGSWPLQPDSVVPRLLASVVIVGLALGILHSAFGYAVYAVAWSWWVVPLLAAPLAALGLWVVLGRRGEPLAWTAGAALAVLVALWIADRGELNPSLLVAVSFLLLLAGLRLYDALGEWERRRAGSGAGPRQIPWRPVLACGGLLLATLYAVAVALPWWTGETFSVIGVLLFFLLVVTTVGSAAIWGAPALPVPRSLRVVGFRQFPLLTFCVVWFLVAGLLDKGGYHNIRVERAAAPAAPVTLQDAFSCWLGKNGLEQNRCTLPGTKPRPIGAAPLVVVATTGGGIRAAYWTDLVLTCAFETRGSCDTKTGLPAVAPGFQRSNALFAASGISGGSLGLASYAAYLTAKRSGEKLPFDWMRKRLDDDSLSASGAWWLLVELPRAFLQFRSPTDRAGILEQGWERAWPDHALSGGLFALWRDHPEAPLLLLNGTSVDDGCRFETSVLDANVETDDGVAVGCRSAEPFDDAVGSAPALDRTRIASRSVLPATRDLVDFLCGQDVDVRLSTAALLSARFPFVNPSARVERRCDIAGARRPVAYVVDGGYLDTSGASPIAELTPRLTSLIEDWNRGHAGRCVVPLMIQIDNGFSSSTARPPRRPAELLVPLETLFATRGAREAEGRVEAALEYDDRVPGTTAVNRYARFVNQSHPGPHAPLGWTQSRFSERELTGQLTQAANVTALAEVRAWQTPGALRCS